MTLFFSLLAFFNFIAIVYLIFLFYKKNNSSKKQSNHSPQYPKINLTRFNPFSDVGGNQSFILVILDNANCGVIITSLHNRDNTRIYAKQIKNGQGFQSTLSREEKSALAQIIKS